MTISFHEPDDSAKSMTYDQVEVKVEEEKDELKILFPLYIEEYKI